MIRIVMIYKPCMSAVMYECRFMLWANSSILDYYVSLIFRSALKVYIFLGGEKKKKVWLHGVYFNGKDTDLLI